MGRAQRRSPIAQRYEKAGLKTENLDYLTKSMYKDSKLQDIQRYLAPLIEPNFITQILLTQKNVPEMDSINAKYADEKKGPRRRQRIRFK